MQKIKKTGAKILFLVSLPSRIEKFSISGRSPDLRDSFLLCLPTPDAPGQWQEKTDMNVGLQLALLQLRGQFRNLTGFPINPPMDIGGPEIVFKRTKKIPAFAGMTIWLIFDAFAGLNAVVEIMFNFSHFCDKSGSFLQTFE